LVDVAFFFHAPIDNSLKLVPQNQVHHLALHVIVGQLVRFSLIAMLHQILDRSGVRCALIDILLDHTFIELLFRVLLQRFDHIMNTDAAALSGFALVFAFYLALIASVARLIDLFYLS